MSESEAEYQQYLADGEPSDYDLLGYNTHPPLDRGCRWCQAMPGEYCEYDCGSPYPIKHPENR